MLVGAHSALAGLSIGAPCDQDAVPELARDQVQSDALRAVLAAWEKWAGAVQDRPQGVQSDGDGGLVGGVLAIAVYSADNAFAAPAVCTAFASPRDGAEVTYRPFDQLSPDRIDTALTAWTRQANAPDDISALARILSQMPLDTGLTVSEVLADDGLIRLAGLAFQDSGQGEVVIIFARAVSMSR